MPQLSTPQPLPSRPFLVNTFSASVQAGFPSPAEDHQVEHIDLMNQLIKHPQATFMLRVSGQSMRDAGILDGSVVLVDRAIKPENGHVVVAVVDGDFTCKTLNTGQDSFRLVAANPEFADIVPKDGQTVEIWGVVVASIVQHGA
ncbi:LexA family transcriptional regulator [Limnohabitans sp. DM1]|uniref:LexA family protein n=1 Tax=Limnohabitans sp. DM1 TaxID=1597955 RepID=UPI000AC73CFD|nr:S24 family peptidase [Limnohabitans sp. DM1]